MLTSQRTFPQYVFVSFQKKEPGILYSLRWNAMLERSETFYLSIMKVLEGKV